MTSARRLAAGLAVLAAALLPASAARALEVATYNMKEGLGTPGAWAPVIGFQEAEVADGDGRAMQRVDRLRGAGYRIYWPMGHKRVERSGNAVPIAWLQDQFDVVTKDRIQTHKGTQGETPSRWVSWVVLRNRNTGKQFAFVNTHFISKAWTSKPARRARWRVHLSALQRAVRGLAAYGPVVVVGDFNRPGYSGIPGVDPLVAARNPPPYDQIYASVPGEAPQPLGTFGSDHNAWRATVKLP